MPSNFSHKLTMLSILLILGRAEAQRCVPVMWVSSDDSKARTNQFSNGTFASASAPSKFAILNGIIGSVNAQPLNYTYPVATFTQLVNTLIAQCNTYNSKGVRLHFVAYDPAYPAPTGIDMTGVKDKQLLLIFSASDTSTGPDRGNFYFIGPNDGVVYTIPAATVTAWVQHYVTWDDTPTGLVTTVDQTDKKNQVPGQPNVYTDTWSIYYDSTAFKDFLVNETNYQIGNGNKIDHIAMDFAAYTDTGDSYNGFKGRMIILYEFIINKAIFYIDSTSDFPSRQNNKNCAVHGADNGQLCPPNCPCTPIPCN